LGFITDFYYVSDAMRYEFAHQLFEGNPRIYNFELDLNSDVRVNIPYQWFDSLGLPRLVRDESIDGIRREEADFFVPVGALDITGWYGLNYVSFGYRMPLPPDSLFDVILGTSYNAEWIDANDEKVLGNIRKAENLRGLGVSRRYLTPRELEQRREATWRND
jgi:hypothetical protein